MVEMKFIQIVNALNALNTINTDNPIMESFFLGKSDELAKYLEITTTGKIQSFRALQRLDISNAERYKQG